MALISGDDDYSSPAKRIKLDHSQQLSDPDVELDFEAFTAPLNNIEDMIKGEYAVNSEVLNNGDSGFNDITAVTLGTFQQASTSVLDSTSDDSPKSEDRNEDTDHSVPKCADDDDDDDDKDEVSSTVSNLSDLSGLSNLSGHDWIPLAGPMSWVQRQISTGANPRSLLNQLIGDNTPIPTQMDDFTIWKIIVNVLSEPPRRQKLRHINTLYDVIRLLRGANKVIVLTGAGVSVSCGIPDFRSRNGIYSRLAVDFPDLPDPQAMFDIQYFSKDPRPFFKFAREIYPGQFKPSPCHRFIKMLEKQRKLLRNYSQNIDTLEKVAGIQNVIECHGSFATATCTNCKYKVTANDIRDDVFAQRIPLCPKCFNGLPPPEINDEDKFDSYRDLVSKGIMKPDIVFFGEGLPEEFHDSMAKDKDECDLLIVIGSSLKVRPVALIPSSIPGHVPQILINREPLPHFNFDIQLLGDSDVIINQICHMLGGDWTDICWNPTPLTELKHLPPHPSKKNNSYTKHENVHSSSLNGVNGGLPLEQQDIKQPPPREEYKHNNSLLKGLHEINEADLLQMAIDTNKCATSSSSFSYKERHMSVDSSTRDSGVCSPADSPLDNCNGCHNPRFVDPVLHSRSSESSYYSTYETIDSLTDINGNPDSVSSSVHTKFSADSTTIEQNCDGVQSCNPRLDCEQSTESECSVSVLSSTVDMAESAVNHRHMSIDSLRDSGIGDGTNSVDSVGISKERDLSVDSGDDQPKSEEDLEALRACWQPKIHESLAARLPENCFYHISPNRYIFPGAEVYYDPDDEEEEDQSSCSSSNSESSDSPSNSSDDETDEPLKPDETVVEPYEENKILDSTL